MRSLVLFLALVAAPVLAAVTPSSLFAQLSVEQLVVQLRPANGESSIHIPVRNDGAQSVVAEIATGDWQVDGEGRHTFHPAGTMADSCGDDLRTDAASVLIEAGATASIRVIHDGTPTDRCRNIVFFRVTEGGHELDGAYLIISTGVKIYVEP